MDLPELNAEEALGRSVVSSKYARRAMGSGAIHPWVFLERLDAPSVSMDRLDHASSGVMVEVGRKRAAARTPTRHFWGWAVLPVHRAATEGRTVEATPREDNPYHVDIVLNLREEETREQQRFHAVDLAERSTWREAP